MATLGENLAYQYALRRKVNPNLRKGQFMQMIFPGRYKSERTAAQSYNEYISGRAGGERLARQAEVERTVKLRGKRVAIGGYEEGLWKVIVHYNATDKDGNYGPRTGSINVHSEEHVNLLSVPYIREAMLPIVDERMDEWCQSFQDCELDYDNYDYPIEVIPLNHINQPAVELDELYISGNYKSKRIR